MPPRSYDPRFDNPLGPLPPTDGEEDVIPQHNRNHYPSSTHTSLHSANIGVFPHGANFLGPMPTDMRDSETDTESALKTLFGENAVPVNGDDDNPQTLASASASATDLQLDPALVDVVQPLDDQSPALADVEAEGDQGAESGTPRGKRKATSRANMLSRGGACEFCKRRKLKCSAEEPACSSCLKAGRECVYSQKKQRSRVKVLEDRLQELEKRLDHQNHAAPSALAAPTSATEPAIDIAAEALDHGTNSSDPSTLYEDINLAAFDLGLTPEAGRIEPDLMTLADAAAAAPAKWPWDGMTPEMIAGEIVKASKGGKGVGEQIIAHLIQHYIVPPSVPFLHPAIPPTTLISRLSPKSGSPLHPTLLLSLLPFLLPLSPSTALHSPVIPSLLLPQSRALAYTSLASNNPQLLDLTAASLVRTYDFYCHARFLEGWTECYSCLGMATATGLGKLGGVGERFAGGSSRPERVAREKQLRLVLHKGVIASPPTSAQDLGHRINLFWTMYLADKAGSVGWGWPSGLNDDEITTPWPQDNYDNPDVLRDNRTIADFLSSTPSGATGDNDFCAQVKALTLLHHSTRLFDVHDTAATAERTANLKRVTEGYMSTLQPIQHERFVELSIEAGPRAQAWIMLHAAMCVLHAKEEIDAPTPEAARGHIEAAINSAGKVVEYIEVAQSSGNLDLLGYDITAATVFSFIGHFIVKLSQRPPASESEISHPTPHSSTPGEPEPELGQTKCAELREKLELIKSTLAKMGRTLKFAATAAQVVENVSLGVQWKEGEYERPDWVV